jgi:uncharacterized lipoprotein YajG
MVETSMMKFLSVSMLMLTAACAWTPDSVAVQRQAVSVAAIPGASSVSVTVASADARQEREISHKKNGYGMRAADINAANDVVEEVRAGVTEILTGQGFHAGRDATVRIELARFYNSFDMGFWSATANAQATANLQVVAADGRSLYSRIYSANHQMTGVQLMSGENAGSALRIALHGLLRQIADDPQLPRALLQSQPALASTPEPASPTRRMQGHLGS